MSIFETESWSESTLELESTFELESPFATGSSFDEAPLEVPPAEALPGEQLVGGRPKSVGWKPKGVLISVTVEGQRQGVFRGDLGLEPGIIRGLRYSFGVSSPRDVASGQASGRRRYEPVTFWHEIGAASPQFFLALTTNEVVKRVLFEFAGVNASGTFEASYRIELGNARVVGVRHLPVDNRASGQTTATGGVGLVEEVGFSFTTVTMSSVSGKTAGADSWHSTA